MIIAFINKYQDKVNRGAETFINEVGERLSERHEVDFLTGINLKKRYDIVIPTNGRLQVLIIRFLTWLSRSKMVVSAQSGIGLDDRINLYSFPNAFVALTDYAYDWARRINPLVKIVKIPNGVDLRKYSALGSRPRDVVLSVGAFTKEKRHDLTIKAVSKLKDVKLIIVGGGGRLKEEIRMLGDRLLGDRFEIKSIPNEKMPEVYQKAGVFAYPVVPWESFGIAMLEALSSGLPVVASNDPIRREIVGDAGIFIDPEDTDSYAEALKNALDKSWGDKPRKQAEKFDWDKIALDYERLFQTLIRVR